MGSTELRVYVRNAEIKGARMYVILFASFATSPLICLMLLELPSLGHDSLEK